MFCNEDIVKARLLGMQRTFSLSNFENEKFCLYSTKFYGPMPPVSINVEYQDPR